MCDSQKIYSAEAAEAAEAQFSERKKERTEDA